MPRKRAWIKSEVFVDGNEDLDEAFASIMAIIWPTPDDEEQLLDFLETFAVCSREEFMSYVAQFPPSPALLWFLLGRYEAATSSRAAKGGAKRAESYALLRDTLLASWEQSRKLWASRARFASAMAEANGQKVTPRQIEHWIRQYEKTRPTSD